MLQLCNAFTLDFETTGIDPKEAKPIEFAVVSSTGEVACNTLLDPEVEIPPETSAVHHITDEDVVGAPKWQEFRNWLRDFCGVFEVVDGEMVATTILVAHNAEYEQGILGDISDFNCHWICTYKCALIVWPDAPSHKNEVLRYWLCLGENRGRNSGQQPHSALHDCQVTMLILHELLKHATLEQLVEWSKLPKQFPVVPFGKHHGKKWDDPTVDYGYLKWMTNQPDMDEDVKICAKKEIERRYSSATKGSR